MAKKKKPDIDGVSSVIPESKAIGRPTEYKQEYCEMLINHMEQGLSFESFAGLIGVWKQTLYNWTEQFPEFLDAKRVGTDKSRLWWERTGHAGMFMGGKDNPFNSTIWVFSMKNRFNWKDKTEVTEKPLKTMSKEELLKEAKELIAREEGEA
jgi:hypothetical protein